MDEIPSNAILEFNDHQLESVRKALNYDLNRLNQDITIFEDWIKKQNHFLVKEFDRSYLERYIISCKGQIERAKKHFDKICTFRGLMPSYLQGLDIKNEFTDLLKIFRICLLPKPTPDNYRVFFTSCYNADHHETFTLVKYNRYFNVIEEYMYRHDYYLGMELIADTRNINLNIIKKLNPIDIANNVMLMVEARGLRLKALHLITGSKFLDLVVSIVKQGLTKKLTSRLHVHVDVESLYKFVPKEILPKDYGGNEPPLEEICKKNFEEYSSDKHIEWIKFMESAATDESKRLNSEFNEMYSGMPGSFKVLNVD